MPSPKLTFKKNSKQELLFFGLVLLSLLSFFGVLNTFTVSNSNTNTNFSENPHKQNMLSTADTDEGEVLAIDEVGNGDLEVEVINQPPTCQFDPVSPSGPYDPGTVLFVTARADDPNGDNNNITGDWDRGLGTIIGGEDPYRGSEGTINYRMPGSYNTCTRVGLTVYDEHNAGGDGTASCQSELLCTEEFADATLYNSSLNRCSARTTSARYTWTTTADSPGGTATINTSSTNLSTSRSTRRNICNVSGVTCRFPNGSTSLSSSSSNMDTQVNITVSNVNNLNIGSSVDYFYRVVFNPNDSSLSNITRTAYLNVRESNNCSVSLSWDPPNAGDKNGNKGSTVTYDIDVIGQNNFNGSVQMRMDRCQVGTCSLSPTSFSLNSGQTRNVTLSVSVPSNASTGTFEIDPGAAATTGTSGLNKTVALNGTLTTINEAPNCPADPVLSNIDLDKMGDDEYYERNENVNLTASNGSDLETSTGNLDYVDWEASAGDFASTTGRTVTYTTPNANDTESYVRFKVQDEEGAKSPFCTYPDPFKTVASSISAFFNPGSVNLFRSRSAMFAESTLEVELENHQPGTASTDQSSRNIRYGGSTYTNICAVQNVNCTLVGGNTIPNAESDKEITEKEFRINASPSAFASLDPNGSYAAKVTASAVNIDNETISDIAVLIVNVQNRDPVVNVDGPGDMHGYSNYYADLEYTFTGEISDPDGDALDYYWTASTGTFNPNDTTSDTNITPPYPNNLEVNLTPGGYRDVIDSQVSLTAEDDYGGLGRDTEALPTTAEPEFEFQLEIKESRGFVYAEDEYESLCEDDRFDDDELDPASEEVVVGFDTGDDDTCTYADEDDDCSYTTNNDHLSVNLKERVEEVGGNNYGQNYVMSLNANYSDNNFRILCVRDVNEDDTNPNNTILFEGERESTREFRAVVGLPAFDAWMQSVGGSLYSHAQPTFSFPYDPNRAALPFRGNVYSLTDETAPYPYPPGSGPGVINEFGNLFAASSSSINVNPSGADFVKNDYSIENCSTCAPKLTQFSEILEQSFADTQNISNISNLNSSPGGAFEYTSNTIGDSGDPNENIEISDFDEDDSGVVVVYIDGDLSVESNLIKPNTEAPNIVFVVPGNLDIHHSVIRIDASFIVRGGVTIEGEADKKDDPLFLGGFLWTTSENIAPTRSSENQTRAEDPNNYANTRPIETFVLYPNLFTGDGYGDYPRNFIQTPIYITALE